MNSTDILLVESRTNPGLEHVHFSGLDETYEYMSLSLLVF